MPQRFLDRDRLPMPLLVRLTVVILFWLLFGFTLVLARNFLYPIALGVLFALLLLPIAVRLEKIGIPRILANLVSIVIGVGAVYGMLLFIYRRLAGLLSDLPELKDKVLVNLRSILEGAGARFGVTVTEGTEQAVFERMENVLQVTGETLTNVLSATGNTLLAVGLMPVYVFMFLYYRDKFARFLLMLVPDTEQALAERILHKVAQVTMRYMTGMFAVVLILCVINSAGFLIIGLKYAVLLGVIAAVCNFIPYFGTILGYSIPFAFAMLTGSGPDMAFAVLLQFAIVQFTENNILTPNIVGSMLRLNPFFIILGVLGGGMLWGLPGMFVVVPVLGMVKVTCDHIPMLKPWGFLLGDRGTEKHSITAQKIRRFFAFSPIAKKETGKA